MKSLVEKLKSVFEALAAHPCGVLSAGFTEQEVVTAGDYLAIEGGSHTRCTVALCPSTSFGARASDDELAYVTGF